MRSVPKGSIVPLVSPFDAQGALDIAALRRLVEWQIESGSHGISVTGTTGEPSALSLVEREMVMEAAAQQIAGRVLFVPATGTNNLKETLWLTAAAARMNADAALIIVPYYNRPSQEGLYRYFREIAESSELPILIYNIPGRTATNMAPETMARLRHDCQSIVGVKESNKDFEHVSRVLYECGRDFIVLSGIELLCYPMLAIGGAGHVSATANILPREVALLYDLVVDGRHAEAADLHYRLLPINEVLFAETNPGPLKWLMGRLGMIDPKLRLPLCEPAPAIQDRLEKMIDLYGLKATQAAGRTQ